VAVGNTTPRSLAHMEDHLRMFCCPVCAAPLTVFGEDIVCALRNHRFRSEAGIPDLFCADDPSDPTHDVTDRVRSFYEQNPFPNYDDIDDVGTLIEKASSGLFASWLNAQIPFNVTVLEIGCGTGQLSNYLGVAERTVFGTDMAVAPLRLAERFRDANGLSHVGFYQMNLFKPVFKPGTFDFVICNGVLHHTRDPFRGFKTISRLVKPGGHILIGLYNRYGRVLTRLRRLVFRATGDRLRFMDPRWRRAAICAERRRTWYLDQYRNPHESSHTYGEVLEWFHRTDFAFVSSLPTIKATPGVVDPSELLRAQPYGSPLDRALVQARLLVSGREGGFFVVIGVKRAADRTPGEEPL
jgi:SAM-dependent methyltransferase